VTQQNPHHERRWWILATLSIAQLMVVLDATVVNIALPSAQKALGFSNDQRQWIITAYSLAFGSLLLLGGKLSDLFGRKLTLIAGLCGFAIASAVGGAAQSFEMLAAARAVQGTFGALLAPAVLSLVTTTFTEPTERNKAFGIFGGVLASGASIGLLLGRALTEWIDWRAVMYVNIVIAVFAVSGALTLLVNQRPAEKPRIDLVGTLTVTAGLFAVVFGLSHAETTSWGDSLTVGFLAAGVVLLALFVAIEARVAHPLLPLRVLADRNRGASYLTILIAVGAMFGTFLFLTYDLQAIKGYSPIRTSLAFLPMTLVVMATSMIGSTLLRPRFGPRWLVTIGMALGAVGML
jgi:EmrB/QacA subfamily drug resistance transporter